MYYRNQFSNKQTPNGPCHLDWHRDFENRTTITTSNCNIKLPFLFNSLCMHKSLQNRTIRDDNHNYSAEYFIQSSRIITKEIKSYLVGEDNVVNTYNALVHWPNNAQSSKFSSNHQNKPQSKKKNSDAHFQIDQNLTAIVRKYFWQVTHFHYH